MTRPETVIPECPETPFPIVQQGEVVSGFGRGSSELGIPTANVPVTEEINKLETGIYYGWSKIFPTSDKQECIRMRNDGNKVEFNYGKKLSAHDVNTVYPMVMSIGWNPFYHNKEKTCEVHIINKFDENFYGANIHYNVLGYIRPELNYTTKGTYY
jgi:riboflavin kinase